MRLLINMSFVPRNFPFGHYDMVWCRMTRDDPHRMTFAVGWNRHVNLLDSPHWTELKTLCPSLEILPGSWAQNVRLTNEDFVLLKLWLMA